MSEHPLLGTTDAEVWATEFCRIFVGRPVWSQEQLGRSASEDVLDEGTMLAWFASAIETGRQAGRRETCPHVEMITLTEDLEVCRECGTLSA